MENEKHIRIENKWRVLLVARGGGLFVQILNLAQQDETKPATHNQISDDGLS